MLSRPDKEDLVRIHEAETIIQTFHDRLRNVSIPAEPGSDLALDEASTPEVVHPAQSAKIMLTNVYSCLHAALQLCKVPGFSGVAPVEVLLRTALIGSCRAALIVAPNEPAERQDNAVRIAQSDYESANKAWKVMGSFEQTIVNASGAQNLFQELRKGLPSGRPRGEERLLEDMFSVLQGGFNDPEDASFRREQMLSIWHGYSGVAHANTWQYSLTGALNGESDSVTTGPLLHHLGALAQLTDLSLSFLEQRTMTRL